MRGRFRASSATSSPARRGSPSSIGRCAGSTGPSSSSRTAPACLIVVHWAQRHQRADQGCAARHAARLRIAAARRLSDARGAAARTAGCRRRARRCRFRASSRRAPTIRWDGSSASQTLAAAWGSRLVDVGAVGHLNPAAGYRRMAAGRGVHLASSRARKTPRREPTHRSSPSAMRWLALSRLSAQRSGRAFCLARSSPSRRRSSPRHRGGPTLLYALLLGMALNTRRRRRRRKAGRRLRRAPHAAPRRRAARCAHHLRADRRPWPVRTAC